MKQHILRKYIRTNNDGDLVLDHHLLDEVSRQDFIEAVKDIAASTELDFDVNDPDFSEAEVNDGINIAAYVAVLKCIPDDGYVYTDRDTKILMAEIIEQELRNRYLD